MSRALLVGACLQGFSASCCRYRRVVGQKLCSDRAMYFSRMNSARATLLAASAGL